MRKITKILSFVGCILNFVINICLSIYMFTLNDESGYLIGALLILLSISSIIELIFIIKSINDKEKKIIIGILGIFLGFLIAGILYLIYDFKTNDVHTPKTEKENITLLNKEDDPKLEKLLNLRSLYSEGIISKEEYEEKKSKLLNNA